MILIVCLFHSEVFSNFHIKSTDASHWHLEIQMFHFKLINMKHSIFLLQIDAKNKNSLCSELLSLIDKLFQLKFNMPHGYLYSLWKKTFQTIKPSNFRTRLIEADYKKWNQCNFEPVTQASLEQKVLENKWRVIHR